MSTNGRHEIISADSNGIIPIDEYGKFPKLCPYSGKYSVKLSNNNNTGAEAEGISYRFTVPSQEEYSIQPANENLWEAATGYKYFKQNHRHKIILLTVSFLYHKF